jgi:hypothetical protein
MSREEPPTVPELSATMIMADAAQVSDGKLSLLGGGIAIVPSRPQPMALALLVTLPYERAEQSIPWVCELLDDAGMPVMAGEVPVLVNGQVSAARAPGWPEHQPFNIPVVITFGALPVQAGRSYTWRLVIDGESDDRWVLGFSVAPEAPVAT